MAQEHIDTQNSAFWDELCGTGLATAMGIQDNSPESLQIFDKAYFDFYPYLAQYVTQQNLKDKKVLEIGLGYGTLGNFIAQQGANYYGLDIAQSPVNMMQYRLHLLGWENSRCFDQVKVGSALEIPHPDQTFDFVYSIGCLHHTGNLQKSIDEVYRVLKPNGKAIIMLYYKNSFRLRWRYFKYQIKFFKTWNKYQSFEEYTRASFDVNLSGEAAPHTDFTSKSDARKIFKQYAHLKMDIQNFDDYEFGKKKIHRLDLLNNVARIVGLDMYLIATK